MKNFLLGPLGLVLMACGGADGQGESDARRDSGFDGSFSVSDSFGGGFDSNGERAEARFVKADLIDLRTRTGRVRAHVRGLPETGPGETDEFLRNNTSYSTSVRVGDTMTRVGCRPGDPIEGRFERSELSGEHVSGEFEFVVTRCEDHFSGQLVEVPGLPMTVTARFDSLPMSD